MLLKTAFRIWKVNNTFHLKLQRRSLTKWKTPKMEKEIMIQGSMKQSGTSTTLWFTYHNKLINYWISDGPKIDLGEKYNPDLLPDHHGNYFHHPKAHLIQQYYHNISKDLIPPWKTYEALPTDTVLKQNKVRSILTWNWTFWLGIVLDHCAVQTCANDIILTVDW